MSAKKESKKQIYILCGPNGAGKTTSAKYLLTKFLDINEFVNADEIARGLSPFNPRSVDYTASKLMLNRINDLVKQKKNFAFETTLSGKTYLKLIKNLQKTYSINLIFLYLDSPQEAKKRVAYRVKTGGHFISDDDIERRYYRGLDNLINAYLDVVDYAILIDSTSTERKIIAKKSQKKVRILDQEIWDKILATNRK